MLFNWVNMKQQHCKLILKKNKSCVKKWIKKSAYCNKQTILSNNIKLLFFRSPGYLLTLWNKLLFKGELRLSCFPSEVNQQVVLKQTLMGKPQTVTKSHQHVLTARGKIQWLQHISLSLCIHFIKQMHHITAAAYA